MVIEFKGVEKTFDKALEVFGNDDVIWQLYLSALAYTRGIGDPYSMQRAAEAYKLYPENINVFTLYKILTYGQSRVDQAKRLGEEGVQLYNEKKYSEAFIKFQEANNLDPIDPVYALNAGFSMYESKQYDKAISFFNLVIPTRHNNDNVLRAMRYKALSLITLNRRQEACQVFDKLRIKGRKRMYNQEYQKYCN